jgi:hypothetical protein
MPTMETLVALDGGCDGQSFDDDHGRESYEWPTGYSITAHDDGSGYDLWHGDALGGNGDEVRDAERGPGCYATVEDAIVGAYRDLNRRRLMGFASADYLRFQTKSEVQAQWDNRDDGRTEREERAFAGPR